MGRARCGSESDHLVAFVLGGFADSSQRGSLAGARYAFKAHDLVLSGQSLLYSCPLASTQVSVILLHRLPRFGVHKNTVLALAFSHFTHVVTFVLDHLFSGKRAGRRFAFDFDQGA